MAKTKGGLFALSARGALGNAIVYSTWRGVDYVRQLVKPKYSGTTEQLALRDLIKKASQAWATNATVGATTIDSAYKLAYTTAAMGRPLSGFNMFMRDACNKNDNASFDGTLVLPTEPGDSEA
jgi:hypothetical protein